MDAVKSFSAIEWEHMVFTVVKRYLLWLICLQNVDKYDGSLMCFLTVGSLYSQMVNFLHQNLNCGRCESEKTQQEYLFEIALFEFNLTYFNNNYLKILTIYKIV